MKRFRMDELWKLCIYSIYVEDATTNFNAHLIFDEIFKPRLVQANLNEKL